MRHLRTNEVAAALRGGRAVEQLLAERVEGDDRILRVLRIDRERDGTFSVAYFEFWDQGSEDWFDIYAFAAYDPDMAYGDITSFDGVDAAIAFAQSRFGAAPERWVNEGMIQDEYADRFHRRG